MPRFFACNLLANLLTLQSFSLPQRTTLRGSRIVSAGATFAVVAAMLASMVGPAHPSGTINLSLSQQLDNFGNPLSGCKLYFYAAGTTTPQSAYADVGLSLVLPNPLECDSAGRLPQFFLADGQIKIRLSDAGGGQTYIAADNILVIGPSGGGGGGGSVDPTTVIATGDIKQKYGTGALTGFVRANGRTIGSATSGATERANSDCQALFEYLWGADTSLAVSGGRGATANADWLANKTITTPDFRGRFIAGLDDMGTTAAGRLPSLITLGVAGGLSSYTIAQGNLPNYNLSIAGLAVSKPNVSISDTGHFHQFSGTASGSISGSTSFQYLTRTPTGGTVGTLGTGASQVYETNGITGALSGGTTGGNTLGAFTGITASLATTPVLSGTLPSGGSGTALTVYPPVLPITVYVKL